MADEELCQLVRGWPKLQVLSISRFVAVNETTIPTFHGLISLLQLCPALTSLTLVIDTTDGNAGICTPYLIIPFYAVGVDVDPPCKMPVVKHSAPQAKNPCS
jgi:hypothetical protein